MPIPRWIDDDTGMPYEVGWKCTKCGWAITANVYEIGRENCILCNSPTEEKRIDYPKQNIRVDYLDKIFKKKEVFTRQ